MNMFKPLMHSSHRTAAILKLTDKHKGPSGVRNEIPALIKQYHNSQWKTQTVNPRCVEQKRKACQSKLIFLLTTSTIKNLSQKTPWPSQNPGGEHWCHKQRVIKGLFIVFTELHVHIPLSMTSRK